MPTLTLEEIVIRAQEIAVGVGQDAAQSPLNDSDMTIEALFDHCTNFVTRQWQKDSAKRTQLREVQNVTFASGVATIPDGLVEDWPADASWYSSDIALNGLVTYCAHKSDAMHHRKGYLYYTWTDGDEIHMVDGFGGGVSGTIEIIAAKQPQISAGSVTGPEHFLEDLILTLAATLRGELPLPVLVGGLLPAKK